jgi:hypothetical protein
MMKGKNSAADHPGIAGAARAWAARADGVAADFVETARCAIVAPMARDGGKPACI